MLLGEAKASFATGISSPDKHWSNNCSHSLGPNCVRISWVLMFTILILRQPLELGAIRKSIYRCGG